MGSELPWCCVYKRCLRERIELRSFLRNMGSAFGTLGAFEREVSEALSTRDDVDVRDNSSTSRLA
jgi:hypothetical protein